MKWFWNVYALFYDSLRHLLPYCELVERTRKSVFPAGDHSLKILDAGCGTGNAVFALTSAARANKQKITVEAVDASDIMLRRAQKKTRNFDNIVYKKADLNRGLDCADRTFDRVICLNVLYAIRDPEQLLREMNRILKPDGTLILANPIKDPNMLGIIFSHFRMITKLDAKRAAACTLKSFLHIPMLLLIAVINALIIKRRARKSAYHFFDISVLETMLKNSGFRIDRVETAYGDTDVFAIAQKISSKASAKDSVIIKLANSEEEMEMIYRLRYDVYCNELDSLDAGKYPDHKETDEYDRHSFHFIALEHNTAIGTLRLVKDSESKFLMEKFFSLPENLDRTKTLEVSRLMIAHGKRGARISPYLIKSAYLFSRARGYNMWCAALTDSVDDMLLKQGWPLIHLGEFVEYHNAKVVPILLCLDDERITFPPDAFDVIIKEQ